MKVESVDKVVRSKNMAKELTKMDYIKNTFYIIISLAAIGSIVFGITSYFATSSQVEEEIQKVEKSHQALTATDDVIAERVDLNISDDRIYQQQQQIRRIKDLTKIEINPNPRSLTEAEKEVIQEKETMLQKLEKEREAKLQYYKNRREQREKITGQ